MEIKESYDTEEEGMEERYPRDHNLALVEKLLTESIVEKFHLRLFPESLSYLRPGPNRGGRVDQCRNIDPNVKITMESLCSKLSFILDYISKDLKFRYYSIFKVMIHLFDDDHIAVEYELFNDDKNLLTSGNIPENVIDLDISTREKAAQLGDAIATKFLSIGINEYKFQFHGFVEDCKITRRWFRRVIRAISTHGIKAGFTNHYGIVCRKL